jgi:hypothetical protein
LAATLGVDVEVLDGLRAEIHEGAGHEHGPRGTRAGAGRMGLHARA